MKNLIVIVMLLFAFQTQAQANKESVKQFIEISGLANKYDELVNRVSKQLSASKQEDFKKDLIYFKNKMIQEMISFYAAKFSQSEIEALIEMYKSPLGKKLVAANEEFASNSLLNEKQFQQEISRLIMKYMN